MKDLDLDFNNMLEYFKKILGIPEENFWKVKEFRQKQNFIDLSLYSQQSNSATIQSCALDSTKNE